MALLPSLEGSFESVQKINNKLFSNVTGGGLSVEYLLSTLNRHSQTQTTIALPFVTGIQFERNQAVDITHTLGDMVLREHAGVRRHHITVMGRSGVQHRVGQDREGNAITASGPALFQELEEFLENYETDMQWSTTRRRTGSLHPKNTNAKSLSGERAHYLLFHAPFENKRFLAEPLSFSFNRDSGSSRHGYTYSIRFALYSVPESVAERQSLLGKFRAAMLFAASAVDTATTLISLVDQNARMFNETTSSALKAPIRAATRLMSAVDSLSGTATATTQIPRDVFMDMLTLFDKINLAGYHLMNSLSFNAFGAKYGQDFSNWMNGVQDFRISANAALGQMFLKNKNEGYYSPSEELSEEAFEDAPLGSISGGLGSTQGFSSPFFFPYDVTSADTLESISKKAGVSEEEIADLNQMLHWDIGPNGVPLEAGSVIYLPASAEVFVAEGDMNIFKTDLLLRNGDLAVSPTKKTDILTVSGVNNLKQGLVTRLLTVEGEVPFFPQLGLPELVGKAMSLTNIGISTAATQTQLLLDNRISSVTSVEVVDSADSLLIKAEAVPVGGAPIELDIPFAVT